MLRRCQLVKVGKNPIRMPIKCVNGFPTIIFGTRAQTIVNMPKFFLKSSVRKPMIVYKWHILQLEVNGLARRYFYSYACGDKYCNDHSPHYGITTVSVVLFGPQQIMLFWALHNPVEYVQMSSVPTRYFAFFWKGCEWLVRVSLYKTNESGFPFKSFACTFT